MRMGKKKIKSIHAHIFRIKQRNEYVNGTEILLMQLEAMEWELAKGLPCGGWENR